MFFKRYCDHRYLHVLSPVFPTRRSSDLQAPLRGRGGLLQGHGQRPRRTVPKPDQFVRAGLCHEASQGADYLAEQQGLAIRSSRKLRRSGLRPRRLLPPPRRRTRPTRDPTAPARPTPPTPTPTPPSPGTPAPTPPPPPTPPRHTPQTTHPQPPPPHNPQTP